MTLNLVRDLLQVLAKESSKPDKMCLPKDGAKCNLETSKGSWTESYRYTSAMQRHKAAWTSIPPSYLYMVAEC